MTAKIIAFPGCSVTELEAEAVEATVEQPEAEDFEELLRPDFEHRLTEALETVAMARDTGAWLAALTSLGNLTHFIRAEVGGG